MMPKEVTITWNDVRVYSPQQKQISVSVMKTTGLLVNETEDFYFVKDPTTVRTESGKSHPEEKPTFYLIPKGMVGEIEGD
jgi:hypothetical protein